MLEVYENCYRVHGLPIADRNMICVYLQGEVFSWCAKHGDEWFAARNIVGGVNTKWEGTPLYRLYQFYENMNRGDVYAKHQAGVALGHLLKYVIRENKRMFRTRVAGQVRQYQWVNDVLDDNTITPPWLRNTI